MTDPVFVLVFVALGVLTVVAAAVDTVADAVGSVVPGQRSTKEAAVLLVILYVAWRRWQSRRGETR